MFVMNVSSLYLEILCQHGSRKQEVFPVGGPLEATVCIFEDLDFLHTNLPLHREVSARLMARHDVCRQMSATYLTVSTIILKPLC